MLSSPAKRAGETDTFDGALLGIGISHGSSSRLAALPNIRSTTATVTAQRPMGSSARRAYSWPTVCLPVYTYLLHTYMYVSVVCLSRTRWVAYQAYNLKENLSSQDINSDWTHLWIFQLKRLVARLPSIAFDRLTNGNLFAVCMPDKSLCSFSSPQFRSTARKQLTCKSFTVTCQAHVRPRPTP